MYRLWEIKQHEHIPQDSPVLVLWLNDVRYVDGPDWVHLEDQLRDDYWYFSYAGNVKVLHPSPDGLALMQAIVNGEFKPSTKEIHTEREYELAYTRFLHKHGLNPGDLFNLREGFFPLESSVETLQRLGVPETPFPKEAQIRVIGWTYSDTVGASEPVHELSHALRSAGQEEALCTQAAEMLEKIDWARQGAEDDRKNYWRQFEKSQARLFAAEERINELEQVIARLRTIAHQARLDLNQGKIDDAHWNLKTIANTRPRPWTLGY